jgi:hypothetical protein
MTEFKRLCEALYGEGWVAKASKEFGISDRTVGRYASGEKETPDEVLGILKLKLRWRND